MIDPDIAVDFHHVAKKFCRNLKRSLFYGFIDVSKILFGVQFQPAKLRKNEFFALSDLSFQVKKGESLGVIGANGSGKSTLLRLITGTYTPDQGRLTVDGRVGSLITLGAGFHPHFTGRENIFFNGTILGLTKKEITSKIDDIIKFADIDEFIDSPVSTYSTGMRMRLGFAVAIHTNPDILLVDEILAVGDINFIKKSYERIESMVSEKGVTAIVVSHNIGMIQRLCPKTLVLDKGKMIFIGDTLEAISKYYQLSLLETKDSRRSGNTEKLIHHKDCPMQMYIEDFAIEDKTGAGNFEISTPDRVKFKVKVFNTLNAGTKLPMVNILILDPGLIDLYVSIQSHGSECQKAIIPASGSFTVECDVPCLNLAPGEYRIIVKLGGPREGFFYDSALLTQPLKVSWSADSLEQMSSIYKDSKLFITSDWKIP